MQGHCTRVWIKGDAAIPQGLFAVAVAVVVAVVFEVAVAFAFVVQFPAPGTADTARSTGT